MAGPSPLTGPIPEPSKILHEYPNKYPNKYPDPASDPEALPQLSRWARSRGTLIHKNVILAYDPGTGLSLYTSTARDVEPAEPVVIASHKSSFSYLNAIDVSPNFSRGSYTFNNAFLFSTTPPHVIGNFFLIKQYNLTTQSPWWPYIRLLPQPLQPSSIPTTWKEDDLVFLKGTNADRAITVRKALWKDEYNNAISCLASNTSCSKDPSPDYPFYLYEWAASIFGSRSFRSSETIPDESIPADRGDRLHLLNLIRDDDFAALFPILDLGNHNDACDVVWDKSSHPNCFSLVSSHKLQPGQQIFNTYGDKSNSELLISYGFILGPENARAEIKLANLAPEVVDFRRLQASHVQTKQAEQEFWYQVHFPTEQKKPGLNYLPAGLIDTLVIMCMNEREERFLQLHPEFSTAEQLRQCLIPGPVINALIRTFAQLEFKLRMEIKRMDEIKENDLLGKLPPKTSNQELAYTYARLEYRMRAYTIRHLSAFNSKFSSKNSICTHAPHTLIPSNTPPLDPIPTPNPYFQHAELLTIECAYEFLRVNFNNIYILAVNHISQSQDEPLPLNWKNLTEGGWDKAYWICWICVLMFLYMRDEGLKNKVLDDWVQEMMKQFTTRTQTSTSEPDPPFYGEKDEMAEVASFIELLTSSVPPFSNVRLQNGNVVENGHIEMDLNGLATFASWVFREEGVECVIGGDLGVEKVDGDKWIWGEWAWGWGLVIRKGW